MYIHCQVEKVGVYNWGVKCTCQVQSARVKCKVHVQTARWNLKRDLTGLCQHGSLKEENLLTGAVSEGDRREIKMGRER